MFDGGRGRWELLPQQLVGERKYCAAATLAGRLLLLGGMSESRSRLNSMEGYDPREGHWQQLTAMKVGGWILGFWARAWRRALNRTNFAVRTSSQLVKTMKAGALHGM